MERQLELLPTVTAERVENISRQTLRMNAHQRRMRVNVTHHESNSSFGTACLRISCASLEAKNTKMPEFRGKICFCPFDSLGFSWRGIHFTIISTDSC